MVGFELYVFFLCLIVFIALTALFSFLIYYIGKQRALLISNGIEDEKIKERLTKKLVKDSIKTGKTIEKVKKILSLVLCAFLCFVLLITAISSCRGDTKIKALPAIKVVASTSMSEKYEKNSYLFKNNLNDQLQLFDVVLLHKLPKEEDLKLYDIVVYEHITGALFIHRIVGIEEPNENHPNERHFVLQGDAVHYPDTFPVRYSQMRSIYRGERIPNVGSFVYFMQSPAGIMCLILFVLCLILMPIADNYLLKKEYVRVKLLVENNQLDKKALDYYKFSGKEKKQENASPSEGGGDDA
ncbi:MAG: hypothetical protein J6Q32_01165 [Clostridia bacterium]|nr:hypothetical protein [Clostridia bacterium]